MRINTIKISSAITVVLLVSITVLGLSFRQGAGESIVDADTSGFAVVELFTSEGCSSCPAADEALEMISQQYKNDVYLLGFHVDYWNRLGWKDAFSSATYSDRQRNYASVFERDGVYTPQAIVNGTQQFVGSDRDILKSAIDENLASTVNEAPVLMVSGINNNSIEVSFSTKENSNDVLNIALVQLHAVTNVQHGENEGRRLSHINIVRDFKTVSTKKASGKISLTIPTGLTAAGCKLIGYIQDGQTFKITGATQLLLK